MEQNYDFFFLAKVVILFCGVTDNSKTISDNSKTISFLESSVPFTLRHVFFFRIHYVVVCVCSFPLFF